MEDQRCPQCGGTVSEKTVLGRPYLLCVTCGWIGPIRGQR